MLVLVPVAVAPVKAPQCLLNCPAGDGGVTVVGRGPANHPVDLETRYTRFAVVLNDLAVLVAAINGPYNPCADFNCDGVVDQADLNLFIPHYGHVGPNAAICR